MIYGKVWTAHSQRAYFTERSGKTPRADWQGPERTGKDRKRRPASLPAGQPELVPGQNDFRLKVDTGDEFWGSKTFSYTSFSRSVDSDSD